MEPQDASTVILLRQGKELLEVFLLRKSRSLEFAAGAYVFPGGKVDEEDQNPRWFSLFSHLTREAMEERMTDILPKSPLGFHVAALRELLEESGLLLSERPCPPDVIQEIRTQLHEGKCFLPLIESFQLKLSPEKLTYYAHWLTPTLFPVRYNTCFFMSELPEGFNLTPDLHETSEGLWMSPQIALKKNEEGALPLMPPTVITLAELSHFDSVKKAIQWGDKRQKILRQPWVDENGVLQIPPS